MCVCVCVFACVRVWRQCGTAAADSAVTTSHHAPPLPAKGHRHIQPRPPGPATTPPPAGLQLSSPGETGRRVEGEGPVSRGRGLCRGGGAHARLPLFPFFLFLYQMFSAATDLIYLESLQERLQLFSFFFGDFNLFCFSFV